MTEIRVEVLEMRSRMWVASALLAALANLALNAPDPLASRIEELARTAERELSESLKSADALLASPAIAVAA